MPASSAAATTRWDAASSIRAPKMLQPRPTTEASSVPILRVSIGAVSRRSGRGRFIGGARVVTRQHDVGGTHGHNLLLRFDGLPRDHTTPDGDARADAERDRDLARE